MAQSGGVFALATKVLQNVGWTSSPSFFGRTGSPSYVRFVSRMNSPDCLHNSAKTRLTAQQPPPLAVMFFGIALQSCKRVNLFSDSILFSYTAQLFFSDPDFNPPFLACLIPVPSRKNSFPIESYPCLSALTDCERLSYDLRSLREALLVLTD